MELFVLLVCLLGVVSSVPVDLEEAEVVPEEAPIEVEVVDDPTLLNKENKRVIRQHDLSDVGDPLLIARNPMDGMYSPDCMPYYGRTHGASQLDVSSYGYPSQHMSYGSAGFKYGAYGGQGSAIPYSQDSQITEHQKPHTYYTTVPYISGYRMSPIYSEKKIVVKDYAHPDMHSGMMLHTSGMHHPHEHYYRSTDDTSETMFDSGMDFNIIFGQPVNSYERSANSELKSADEYDKTIDELRQRLEHLESLRQNINENEEYADKKDQLNYV